MQILDLPIKRYIIFYFLQFSENQRLKNDDVSMMSAKNNSHVDHEFVVSARNWTRGLAILARGEVEEHGERRLGPYGRRSMAGGDHGAAAAAVHGDGSGQRGRRKKEVSGRTASSPGARRAGRRGVGTSGTTAMVLGRRRQWRRGTGRWRRTSASRVDCCGGEVEELEEELVAASSWLRVAGVAGGHDGRDRKSTRLNSSHPV